MQIEDYSTPWRVALDPHRWASWIIERREFNGFYQVYIKPNQRRYARFCGPTGKARAQAMADKLNTETN